MGLYERYLLPHIIDFGCGSESVQMQRGKVVPLAEGRVLEIGIGYTFSSPFDLRFEVPLLIPFAEVTGVVPLFMLTAGFRF